MFARINCRVAPSKSRGLRKWPAKRHGQQQRGNGGLAKLVFVLAACFVLSQAPAAGQVKPVRRVLVLIERNFSWPAVAAVDQEIRAAPEKSPYAIEVYSEYTETILFPREPSYRKLREWYRNRKPDVIIAAGLSPIKFIVESHEKLFRDTQIVICGSSEEQADNPKLDSDFTGVWMTIDPAKTLDAGLQLQPSTQHVVGGVSSYDKHVEAIVREQLRSYESNFTFEYLSDLKMSALLERLRHLSGNTLVFCTSLTQDTAGTDFIPATESVPIVANVANAPVFVMADTLVGRGTPGGYMVSFAVQGKVAAEIAMRVLQGERPQDLPIVRCANVYIFDWRALRRWGFKEGALPPGSIVQNRQPSIWESYKSYIIGGISLCLAETLLVLGLLWQRAKRRKVEAQLVVTNDQLRLAMESGKAVGWERDIRSGQDSWFGDLKTMFGISSDTYVGHPEDFHRYVHPEDRQQVSQAVADAEKNHSPYAAEFRVVWPDGTVRWVAASGKFYYSTDSEPERMLGMAVDITDRKQLQAELRESQDRMGAIVASAMDAIIAIDDTQRIVLFNASAEKMFGCLAEDALGSPIERFIPQRFRAAHRSHIRHFGETGISGRNMGTLWALRANGDEFPIEASISHVNAAGKKLFTVILRDVTDRTRAMHAVLTSQAVLRESEERLRMAMDAAKLGGWEWDLKSGHNPWFGGKDRLLEMTSPDRSGSVQDLWDRVHPEDLDQLRKAVEIAKQNHQGFEQEFRVVWPDGTVRWLRSVGRFFYGPDGEPERTLGISTDITERKLAEQALLQREAELTEAQWLAQVGSWRWEVKTDTVSWSKELYRIAGMDPGMPAVSYKDHSKLYTAESWEHLRAAVEEALRTGRPYELDLEMIRVDGARRWLIARGEAQRDASGAVAQLRGTVQDITERKRTEEALRESEARFRLVANTAPVLIWMSDTDKLCTYFSVPWLEFTGRSIESELGNGWAEGVHPEDFKACLETYTKAFDRRERFSMEYRLRRHDGEYRWVLDIGVPRFNEDGSFAGFIGSCVDVTDRRAAQQALRASEDKLRLLLDSTAEAIYGIDLEGRCTFCNPACLRALGYQRVDDLLGKNMHELIHHTRADGTLFPVEECQIFRAFQNGEGVHVEDEVLWRANGTSFPVEYWSHPQRKGQEVVGAVVTFLDITERKRTEVVLENLSRKLIGAQEQERSRIARELHDDIGQRLALLTVELGQLPQHSPDLPAEVGRGIDELREQASEIAADVQSLSHELHSSKLEYLGIATAMRGFCREFSAQQNVEIVFAHDHISGTVPSDISLCLFRVLQEALHNAVKYSGVRHFDAELRASSDAIDLTVRDSGSSFDVEEGLKTSGLGLVSMTERIKLVGGQLSIESYRGRGTTIHARVPLREAARAAP